MKRFFPSPRHLARPHGGAWWRALRGLLLPLLLVAAQQGALLHEIGHYAASDPAGQSQRHPGDGRPCELCLGFAQVASPATPAAWAAALLTGLSFAPAAAAPARARSLDRPAPKSRGPPSFL